MRTLSPVELLLDMVFRFLRLHSEQPLSSANEVALKEKIEVILDSIAPREKEIIKMRYGLGDGHRYTVDETRKVFSLTRDRLRQIEARAALKLRQPIRAWKFYQAIVNVSLNDLAEKIRPHLPPPPPPALALVDISSIPGSDNTTPLNKLGLDFRNLNALESEGIFTIGELVLKTEDELLQIRNFRQSWLDEVREKLQEKGLKLRGDA